MIVSFVVFEYLTERYFLDLNARMIEESKQAVSIGPSLLSSAHLTSQKAANSSRLQKTEMKDINSSNQRNIKQMSGAITADGKRKEKCSIA